MEITPAILHRFANKPAGHRMLFLDTDSLVLMVNFPHGIADGTLFWIQTASYPSPAYGYRKSGQGIRQRSGEA